MKALILSALMSFVVFGLLFVGHHLSGWSDLTKTYLLVTAMSNSWHVVGGFLYQALSSKGAALTVAHVTGERT